MFREPRVLFPALAALVASQTHAQLCGTASPTPAEYAYTRDVVSQIDVTDLRNAGTTCVPLQAQVVRLSDGTGGITQAQLNIGLSFLNHYYLDAGIEFFWKGPMNTTNNTDYSTYNTTAGDGDTEAGLVALFATATDAVNVYFVNSMTTIDGSLCGYAYFPFNSAASNRVFMVNGCTTSGPNGTLTHEFGHYFNLFHTFEGTAPGDPGPDENVPRIGPQANCIAAGDLLCGTEADPNGAVSSCVYTGGGTDMFGNPYDPMLENIMSYYPSSCSGVLDGFTADQYTRLGQGLTARINHTAYELDAPPQSVTAPSGLGAVASGNGLLLNWTDNAANDLGYLVERSTTSAAAGFRQLPFGSTAASGNAYTDNTVVSSTTYYYRVKATNGNCNTYSNVATITTGLIYCIPTYSNGCGTSPIADFIFNGQGSTISNINSGCSTAQYGNYTALSANVTAGNNHTLTAHGVTGGCCTYSPRYIQIWVDWNQDGDFIDGNETMLPALSPMAPTFNGNFTVPAAALNGGTRMRVRAWDQANGCPVTPCNQCIFGETEDYALVVSGGAGTSVQLAAKLWLEGPFVPGAPALMHDSLRTLGLVPLAEPYTALGFANASGGGGETIAAAVLIPTGANAVVDWVRIELRSSGDPTTILATRQCLLQRDGDVVSTDGTSNVTLNIGSGSYYVAVRHRNHLGAMTSAAIALSGSAATIDFRSASTLTFGTGARKTIGSEMVLWAGNTFRDSPIPFKLIYVNVNNDRDPILTAIGGVVPTNTVAGYLVSDCNLDGRTKYVGTGNDRDYILQNIGGVVPTATRTEQLP